MLPDAQLLTILTSVANHIPGGQSAPVESDSILSSLRIRSILCCAEGQEQLTMAHHDHQRPRSSANTENELWFNMSSSTRQQEGSIRPSEQSAYRETNHRRSTGSNQSGSTRSLALIPSISTTIDLNKALPPSPTESERKRRRPAYLRSWLGRSPSSHLDPTRLSPQPYQPHHSSQRHSASGANLSVQTHTSWDHAHSRSMPSSPYEYGQAAPSTQSRAPRASSATANYPDAMIYQPYTPPLQQSLDTTYFAHQPRPLSPSTNLDTTPSRSRTFPSENSKASPTMREGVSNRPRPYTWLSPTDSFSDPSQFSLFVQATTGLPEDADPLSPNDPPQLRGSLFARRSANDVIPLPFRNEQTTTPRQLRTDWQNFEPPPFTNQAVSGFSFSPPRNEDSLQLQQSPHMAAVNRELELLGLEDEDTLDEELPDYAQSQAEAHARRRAEATERARELEARWRNPGSG